MDRARNCAALAGTFRTITSDRTAHVFFFTLAPTSIILTALLRHLVLGYVLFASTSTSAPSSSATPIPSSPDCRPQASPDLPPPYSEEERSPANESSPAPSPDTKKVQISQLRTTTDFAYGTTLFALNILVLVLLAFTIQCMVFCAAWPSNPNPTIGEVRSAAIGWWFLYGFIALWASFAATSWTVLLRDYLSGPDVAYERSIEPAFGIIALFFVILFPFVFIWLIVTGLIKFVIGCIRGLMSGVKMNREEEAANLMELGDIASSSTSLPEGHEVEQNESMGRKQAGGPLQNSSKPDSDQRQ